MLSLIRERVSRPLLRKDFTLHEVQIYQAALAGADAVLLIVAELNDEELTHLMKAAGNCGIDAVVEVHDEPELNRALTAGGFVYWHQHCLCINPATRKQLAAVLDVGRAATSS
jgi:indole-3-glycerol phosphate synthase